MIRFFRVNDPYRLVFVFIILALVRIIYGIHTIPLSYPEFKHLLLGEWLGFGFSMYVETFDHTAPLSAWTYKMIDLIFGRSRVTHWVLSGLLLFFQASFFNRTLMKNRVLSELNYLPSFLYVIFSVAVFDFFSLSPQLLSLTLIIISMDYFIRGIDNSKDELFLFQGFFLGIAGLFYLPSSIFFLAFLVAIITITRATFRKILLFLFGWLIANLIVLGILYFLGILQEFWDVYFIGLFRTKIYYVKNINDVLSLIAIPTLIFVFSLFSILWNREKSLHIMIRQFMFFIFLAALCSTMISGTFSGTYLVFFIPVFTFFISNYFIKLKGIIWRILFPTLIIWGSLLTSLCLQFNLNF